ncbi:MAG: PIN domain-containing protein [Leptolyngbyaceae cyanobacterium]
MSAKKLSGYFLDSNIWIYALADGQDQQKQDVAAQLIRTTSAVVSTQVINEVYINLLRKSYFSEEQVRELITAFYQGSQVIPFDMEILTQASSLRERYALSFWDSLIVASALHAGLSTLYSEDMQHGLLVNGQLEILNPFG